MGDLGLLLSLPLESIAVRAVLASVVVVALLRLLLRAGVRSISARVAMALAPAAALLAVVVVSSRGDLQLPTVMLPAEAAGALPILVTDGYLYFAPIAVPLLVTTWATVVGVLLVRRGLGHRRARQAVLVAEAAGEPPPALLATVACLSARLKVTPPAVVAPPTCPGGAYVVGTRRPTMVVGRDLLDRLDAEELEGVLAHELAHVRRRDNLVATLLGAVRDATFFVPGGRWSVAQLHRERERAADQLAVATTARPAALASGLLKTVDGPPPALPCATLVPTASLVERVTDLIEDRPPISPVRRGSELSAVGAVVIVASVVAVALPSALTGAERQRDAVAVVWSASAAAEASASAAEARAFDVYRRARLEVESPRMPATVRLDESSVENRPSTWRACMDVATCPEAGDGVGLGLVPRTSITLDEHVPWHATPAFSGASGGDGLPLPSLYWLQRVN